MAAPTPSRMRPTQAATGSTPASAERVETLEVRCTGCGRRAVFGGFDRATLGQAIAGAGWVVATVRGELEGWCKACADARPGEFLRAGEGS